MLLFEKFQHLCLFEDKSKSFIATFQFQKHTHVHVYIEAG